MARNDNIIVRLPAVASWSDGSKETVIDLKRLRNLGDDFFDKWTSELTATGEAGGQLVKALPRAEFESLVKALADGRPAEAESLMRKLLNMLTMVTTMAATLATNSANESAALRLQLDTSDGSVGAAVRALLTDWARSAERVAETVARLQEIETEALRRQAEVAEVHGVCREIAVESGSVEPFRRVFEGGAENDGFLQLSRSVLNRDPGINAESVRSAYQVAKERFDYFHNALSYAREEWTRVREQHAATAQERSEVDQLTNILSADTRSFLDHQHRLGKTQVRPYTAFGGEPIMSQDQFVQVEQYIRDSRWAPRVARTRIMGIMDNTASLLQENLDPPDQLVRLVDYAQFALQSVEGYLSSIPAVPTAFTESSADKAAAGGAEVRLEEVRTVYELMGCLAVELASSKLPLPHLTVKSALRKLRILGKIEAEHERAYAELLEEHLHKPGVREVIAENKDLSRRWEECSCFWLRYRPTPVRKQRHWGYKLTKAGVEWAEALLATHGLTRATIRAAQLKDREEMLALAAELRKARANKTPTPDEEED